MPINKLITTSTNSDEPKFDGGKYILSKIDQELYHEKDDIQFPVIRIKHFNLPGNNERWKIFSDSKVVFVIEGKVFNKKERAFLCSIEGINFLIQSYKEKIKSFNALKLSIKKRVKEGLTAKGS